MQNLKNQNGYEPQVGEREFSFTSDEGMDYEAVTARFLKVKTDMSEDDIAKYTLRSKKTAALESIKKEHARLLNVLSGSQTTEERDTWPIKKELVSSFLNGTVAQKTEAKSWLTKMLKTDETVEDYVDKIQQGIQANMLLMTSAEGMKRNGEALIESLTDVDAIDVAEAEIMAGAKVAEASFLEMIAAAKA